MTPLGSTPSIALQRPPDFNGGFISLLVITSFAAAVVEELG
jgi:hypothetical protein